MAALIKALETSDKEVTAVICGALLSVGGEEAHKAVEAYLDGVDLSYVMENYARIIAEGDFRCEFALLVALEESSSMELARHLFYSGNGLLMVGARNWIHRTEGFSEDFPFAERRASHPKWGEDRIEK